MSRLDRFGAWLGRVPRWVVLWSSLGLSVPVTCHAQAVDGMTVLAPLNFGTIAVLGPGAVTVFAEGNRLAEGQAYFVGAQDSRPAQVVVASRAAHMTFSLSLPDSFVLESESSPARLTVSRLTPAPVLSMTGPSATSMVSVGATLRFSSIPTPGRYTGSFQISLIWP
jgi:hypothetical protein